jgi:hypothetical protein
LWLELRIKIKDSALFFFAITTIAAVKMEVNFLQRIIHTTFHSKKHDFMWRSYDSNYFKTVLKVKISEVLSMRIVMLFKYTDNIWNFISKAILSKKEHLLQNP